MTWQFAFGLAVTLAIISLLVLGLEAVRKLSAIAEDIEAIRATMELNPSIIGPAARSVDWARMHHLDE